MADRRRGGDFRLVWRTVGRDATISGAFNVRTFLSGNEALARGAYEGGVLYASAYPGTPSTEILETIAAEFPEIYAEWAPNEKVALEVGIGCSFTGSRALVAMKHVGVNVASDPLMTLAYTGVKGGLVLVAADDPGMHSSQNEQDSRFYQKFSKIICLEPSDSAEAKEMVKDAFELSEKTELPVMLRTLTRISHTGSAVEFGEMRKQKKPVLEVDRQLEATMTAGEHRVVPLGLWRSSGGDWLELSKPGAQRR